jgi:hypothetical protein
MSELVDLVNDSGEVLYRTVPRERIGEYPDARMQIIIAIIVNSQREVLVHERAKTKSYGGKIDLVCGAIQSHQTPITAAMAESGEEVGPVPDDFEVIKEGKNEYGKYRFLLLGHSDKPPKEDLDPDEVAWAGYVAIEALRAKAASGEWQFVDGFFEDLDYAMNYEANAGS